MKRYFRYPIIAAVIALPCITFAAEKKGKKRRQAEAAAEVSATTKPAEAKPAHDPTSPWHTWSDGQGHELEGKYKALENGFLTVEGKDGMLRRFALAKLTAADQKFANECKNLQPRPSLAADVISRAAARLDETILAALQKNQQKPNAPANDETFARRLYLDTIGRIATHEEVTVFLNDKAPNKRAKLVDTLLNSPGYTMHMFNWLADMLRVKDDYGKGAKSFVFEDWLKDMVAINRPWDALVSDMLTADGKLTESGPAGLLLRDAQMPLDGVSNLLTTFLGADVSCAQCHDHPLADWTQKDFYQMAAFFGATDGYHEDVAKQIKKIAKSGNVAAKGQIQNMLASNAYDLVDLKKVTLEFPKDYKYDNAKPGQTVEPALIKWQEKDKFSPAYNVTTTKPTELRDEFAKWMTSAENPRFATAIANRLWKKAFGLAVQEPVNDLDDPKAASNPELLAQITTYMKQAKFDLREFQRIIFNTAAYQRQASPTPDLAKGHYYFAGPLLRRMSAEQAWDSMLALAVGPEIDQTTLRRGDTLKLTAIDGKVTAESAKEVIDKLKTSGYTPAKGGNGKKGPQINARQLSQFYDGGVPPERAGLLLARASELTQPAPESHFLRLFGQSDRLVADTNTSDGSVPQVMSMMNGPVQQVVTGTTSTTMVNASKASTPQNKVDTLYVSFLGRHPSPDESKKSASALGNGLTETDLAWVLLNSREFLFVQ